MKGPIEVLNKKISVPVARKLSKLEFLHPNHLTLFSFFLSGLVAPYLILTEHYRLSALFVWLGAILDSLDGDLARIKGLQSKEGAILDAVLDRYVDLFILGALVLKGCLVSGLLAMVGSCVVPYVRAKTEAVGKKSTATLGSRDVRNALLVFFLLLNEPCAAAWSVALLSNLSALHRLLYALKKEEKND